MRLKRATTSKEKSRMKVMMTPSLKMERMVLILDLINIDDDLDNYGDRFEENDAGKASGADDAAKKGNGAAGTGNNNFTMYPNSGISVEVNLGIKNNSFNEQYIPIKT
jgi:hypothetical protein